MKKVEPCCVYAFMTDPDQAPVFIKVGVSKAPEARVAGVQTGCPLRIKSLRIIETPSTLIARAAEASIHQALKQYHTCGEWFRFEEDLGVVDRVLEGHFGGRGWPERSLGFEDASAAHRSIVKSREEAFYKQAINRRRMDANMAPIGWD